MFGDFDPPSGTEHRIFPILKLIDFDTSGLGGGEEDPDADSSYSDEQYEKECDRYNNAWGFKTRMRNMYVLCLDACNPISHVFTGRGSNAMRVLSIIYVQLL